MSQANVEVVRRFWAMFQQGLQQGDPALAFDHGLAVRDHELRPAREVPGPRSYVGREGMSEFVRVWTEDFEDWRVRAERFIDASDNRVVILAHQSATGKGSGVPVDLSFGIVNTVEAGVVTRTQIYLDRSDAMKAAGLRE